ncbi:MULTISPECIES: hypothetical protein [Bacillus]|uniref:Uncharacterized protein n=2 Tax=Bacillus cereus group TaxID=86661 RepID=A0ABU8HVW4_9BACI|nr:MULTISPECIES: hypothetical protein [Bacillus]KYQ00091.1 hypothetical protein B4079_4765 [Bacillus cereus]MCD9102764.1 hypothetical protein [Bacillus sp. PLB03]MCU4952554.1 hypothetical protein [Bacillus paranthracis]MCU5078018.1 hypothetical protein [Bacillus cereus]MCU5196732.1 hypothetical protein [Bacillus mobilis]
MHKSNEKTNANVIVCFFVTIITIIIVWFVFPAIQSAMTEYEIEEETVKKGRLVQAKVIDKKFIEGDPGNPLMGDTGSPDKHLITLYAHEKMRIIDVKSDVFNQIDVGNEIKAYEYKERITIEQEKRKSGWD